MKYLLIDLYGTCLNSWERGKQAYREATGEDTENNPFRQIKKFSDKIQSKFWELYYLPEFVKKYDKPIPGSIESLKRIATEFGIIYLSWTKGELGEVIEEVMMSYGFPMGSFYLREKGYTGDKRSWKIDKIKEILSSLDGEIIHGIGDGDDDIEAYEACGISGIRLSPWSKTPDGKTWEEIEEELFS